ncbi:TonB-dependent receptor domain-containing protein [Kordiimonas sp. SCSIO 12610]|uniref:TonB-dependent receptor domain-containing protein n=1 Tax=Kordiimonas sp. SCSIO 12610 TaxID=2829597 RepID=UPI00210EE1A9|nr:TonB-dependent receptor [Kordiimonas sp. SCSIO 12610]UTW54726.1 TonB-dependent receptor [Kordiimonas sp. SCSIO 12610]
MRGRNLLRSILLGSISLSAAQGVYAQNSSQDAGTDEDEVFEEIVVTGTQIKGSDIAGSLPVTVLDSEAFKENGFSTGEDILRAIPQVGSIGFGAVRGGITGVNAARGDIASFNLRSIGEGNTLVLINGRRTVLHPITQTSSFDGVPVTTSNANALPPGAIERVEVLRDGAAALYGADAVAGVVNYLLQDDFTGTQVTGRIGFEEDGGQEDFNFKVTHGFDLNEGRTNIVVSASYDNRSGFNALQKDFINSEDLRSLVPEEFAGDLSLDNRSSLEVTPFFDLDGIGTFHLRPTNLTADNGSLLGAAQCGGRGLTPESVQLTDGLQSLCIDSGSHNRALRPNRLAQRTLIPDNERVNIFGFAKHEINSNLEAYAEVSYYYAQTERTFEQASILSNGRFFVPADYFYNPFGPVTFADGRVNPNRLPGLDPNVVPEEGLGFELLSLRPVDLGPREIEVTSYSYRFLGGLRGNWGEWDFDTAVLYSAADTIDRFSNRISTSLLQQSLSLDTPDAYNIFTGVNPSDPSSIVDLTVNPRSVIEPFLVDGFRDAESSLFLADFKVSNPSVFELPAGGVGVAAGIEYRRETLDENNSAIFDGSQPFIDPLDTSLAPGEVTNLSNLQGSSVRPDFNGDRNVFSAYAEALIPVVRDAPLAQSIDIQLAGRYERFSGFGDIFRPKFALSWFPIQEIQFRGAYSLGFRAPNLVQLNSPATSITTGVDDYAEGILLGTGDINNGPDNGNYILETAGNPDLEPERTKNLSLGVVIEPTPGLIITADFWRIEQNGTVGVFSDENESRLDAVLRAQGSFNPSVIRGTPDEDNPLGEILIIQRSFENLGQRITRGLDFGINYSFETDIGGFNIDLNAARLLAFNQAPSGAAQALVDFGANPDVLGAAVGSALEIEFFPKWRGTGRLTWNSNDGLWGASLFANYVGEVFEPTVTDPNGNFFQVDDQIRVNTSIVRRDLFIEDTTIRIGVNNLFDVDPPLADESFGFEGELHSPLGRLFFVDYTINF